MSSSEDEIEYVEKKAKTNDSTISLETSSSSNRDDSKSDDDDNDEDESQPTGAECLELCKQFAEITETDRALAMFYLQNNKWSLERSLDEFLKQTGGSSKSVKDNKRSKVVACFDVNQLNEDEKRHQQAAKHSHPPQTSSDSSKRTRRSSSPDQIVAVDQEDEEKDKYFKIMSWNIDGLDKCNVESRAMGVCKTILNQKPDVVLLQEVVDTNEEILRRELSQNYEFSSGDKFVNAAPPANHYYTMVLNKRKSSSVISKTLIDLPSSVMGRNLLEVKVNYMNKVNFCVLTSHLESTGDFAKQRMEQLRFCFDRISKIDKNYLVFFGGDLNLRDSELSGIGGIPQGCYDVWESTGSRKECLYTWDCTRNSNLRINARFKPRLRFDRLYIRPSKIVDSTVVSREVASDKNSTYYTLTPVYFELEGLEKLKSCGRFCSDHWAIQAYCNLESSAC